MCLILSRVPPVAADIERIQRLLVEIRGIILRTPEVIRRQPGDIFG